MTARTKGQPVAPSLLVMLAEAWALADPRCYSSEHNVAICLRHECPACHLSLGEYVAQLREVVWP
jgi:heterodisulfide reductase subunit B